MVERYLKYAEAWHKEPIAITFFVITELILNTMLLRIAWRFLFLIYQKAYCDKRLDQLQKLLPVNDYQFVTYHMTDKYYWQAVYGYSLGNTLGLRADIAYRLIRNKANDKDWLILYHEYTHGEGARDKAILRALDCDGRKKFHPDPFYLYAFEMCLQAYQDICGLQKTFVRELCLVLTSRQAYKILGRDRFRYYNYSNIEISLEETMANINAGMLFYLNFHRMPKIRGMWWAKIVQRIPKTFEKIADYPNAHFAGKQALWGASAMKEGKASITFPNPQ